MQLKYITLADALRNHIRTNGRRGEQLPTEHALMEQFQVSRQTVRQALTLLLEEGLIEKRQGSGSYIKEDALPSAAASRSIAILTCSMSDHTSAALWNAQSVLSASGYQTQLFSTENLVMQERRILENLIKSPVRAILVEGTRSAFPNPNHDLYEKLLNLGSSILFLGNGYSNLPQIPCVCSGDYEGAQMLTNHLIRLGHTKIGGIFSSDRQSGHSRYFGCLCALRDQKLTFDDRRILWYDSSQRSSPTEPVNRRQLLSYIQTHLSECTAVICYNDEVAGFLIRELQKMHIRIPEQISVVGFDNSYFNDMSPVSITTAAHTNTNLWKIAAHGLLQLIEGKTFRTLSVPLILIKKDSDDLAAF